MAAKKRMDLNAARSFYLKDTKSNKNYPNKSKKNYTTSFSPKKQIEQLERKLMHDDLTDEQEQEVMEKISELESKL